MSSKYETIFDLILMGGELVDIRRRFAQGYEPLPEKDASVAEAFFIAHPHPQYNRYNEPKNFKKFAIEHGNVVWGKNWDMIFPIEQLYKGTIA